MQYVTPFFGQLFILTLSSKVFQFGILKDSSWFIIFLPIILPIATLLLLMLVAFISQKIKNNKRKPI
jgi:hypothetical protein